MLHFLPSLLDSGSGYSVIGTHKSAISTFHEPTDGISVGKQNRVCTLMSGVFKKRLPISRYYFI